MPNFFTDAIQNLWNLWYGAVAVWYGFAPLTRVLIALGMAGLAIYGGSRTETSGMSMILFFCAFAFFAYVVTAGYALVQ